MSGSSSATKIRCREPVRFRAAALPGAAFWKSLLGSMALTYYESEYVLWGVYPTGPALDLARRKNSIQASSLIGTLMQMRASRTTINSTFIRRAPHASFELRAAVKKLRASRRSADQLPPGFK